MKIYIGYSNTVDVDALKEALDVDPAHPRMSRFRRAFGTGYIRPGDFELYRPESTGGEFSRAKVSLLMPFEPGDVDLFDQDLSEARVVFYIHDEQEWATREALGIKVTDCISIAKFDYA